MNTSNVEIFKDIPNYEGFYQVSNIGNVRSINRRRKSRYGYANVRGQILKQSQQNSYMYVQLHKNNRIKCFAVHQLVAMAFLGHIPNGHQIVIDHINCIKSDNRLENIRLVTQRYNLCRASINRTSGFIGVRKGYGNKWRCSVRIKGKNENLGSFDTKEQAKEFYDSAVKSIETGMPIEFNRTYKRGKYVGVNWHSKQNVWRAYYTCNKKSIHIGTFKTEEDAYNARNEFLKSNK